MDCASDTYLPLSIQSPNLVDIALSHCNLALDLNEWVLLRKAVLLFVRLSALLIHEEILDLDSLLHDLLNSINCLIVDGLVVMRGLIYSQVV